MSSDKRELAGLQRLDLTILTEIHTRYYPLLYRYARFRLNDDQAAEDLAAEAFLRLLEAVKSGNGPTTTLRGWLMGTLANLINDHYRQAYRHPQVVLEDDALSHPEDPQAQVEQEERQASIQAALACLTEEQQHVLSLRFGSGYSLEEVARIMGKKANAIKALQFRAIGALRRHLGG